MNENQNENENETSLVDMRESVIDAVITEEVEVKPTYEALELLLTQHSNEITRLTNLNNYYFNRLESAQNNKRRVEAELETYLDENWDDLGEHAEEISRICDVDVSKTVTVSVTATFNIEVSVPRNELEDINRYDFDFTVDYSGAGDMDSSDYEIDDFRVEN